ncbi:hypothetical protein REPUB_Repub17cG0148600 [Reevesia pubescens]
MEYLLSNKIYHGYLNPSNIHVKSRGMSTEGYIQAKVSGFGSSSLVKLPQKNTPNQNETRPFIWHAPELLTGKVPFEDSHLQGDKMSRNIRAGERPLFPSQSPKMCNKPDQEMLAC